MAWNGIAFVALLCSCSNNSVLCLVVYFVPVVPVARSGPPELVQQLALVFAFFWTVLCSGEV